MKTPAIEGSSKQFFSLHPGVYLMTFKDLLHGASREGAIPGTGYLRQVFSYYFYRLLEKEGLRTHLTEDPMSAKGIVVKEMEPVKMEIIVRNIARGQWVDEHKVPLFVGGESFTPPLVEFCLKWKTTLADGRVLDDPRITPELALHLNQKAKEPALRGHLLRSLEEAEELKNLALFVNKIYSQLLLEAGWILEDFKFEVGVLPRETHRHFYLIDEISPDCSRIRDKEGQSLTKDLFRQRRPEHEIYQGYRKLKEWMEQKYETSH